MAVAAPRPTTTVGRKASTAAIDSEAEHHVAPIKRLDLTCVGPRSARKRIPTLALRQNSILLSFALSPIYTYTFIHTYIHAYVHTYTYICTNVNSFRQSSRLDSREASPASKTKSRVKERERERKSRERRRRGGERKRSGGFDRERIRSANKLENSGTQRSLHLDSFHETEDSETFEREWERGGGGEIRLQPS